ncbi:SRPBCC family protein [Nocardia stercoris]|uniref:SRPBCC family protein n=1 Tax=Nocardia stercoris TaxID=2483361 RepID=A0A3M2KZY4_9NOCA|nr:SRPBCC family protein [Nocardia stercoris]RMI27868.1 SRPBCC family protein [Nocardia stercoris]
MVSTTVDTLIRAPREQVYKLFVERDALSGRLPIDITLLTPGAPEPSGVGAVYQLGKFGLGAKEQTTELVPNERMEYKVVGGLPVRNHVGTVTFTDAPEGTLVSYRMVSEPSLPAPAFAVQALLRTLIKQFLSAAKKAV